MRILTLIISICFSIFFEWLNIQTGFLMYTHWKLYYSIPTYPVSGLMLIRVYRYIRENLPEPNS